MKKSLLLKTKKRKEARIIPLHERQSQEAVPLKLMEHILVDLQSLEAKIALHLDASSNK